MIALFDLDGTLTNPKTGITRSVQYALDKLGRPAREPDELTWMIGPPIFAGFTELLGESDEVRDAVRLYRERYGTIRLFDHDSLNVR
ncbi:HAD hydrolase-like protein [Microvirga sp. BT688]|uniref:HAD hydrolase-like protein n=1 Tax=Microvirga sp. TaxID=1873136 RepID=UPI00168338A5|nr:HAD hydrolase-like protein [Microvirga sp.]MBD2748227.1 HAD hydrolase-like protein [Microvirga sp.]